MKLNRQLKVNGQIKDRGTIKWTAMMLPEHVQMLRDWQKHERSDARPYLDEFDLEALYEEIHLAYRRQCLVEIQVWQEEAQAFTGIVTAIDLRLKMLSLDSSGNVLKFSFDDIIGAAMRE
ncbi:YolD-like family protein [Planococcus sp. APC 3906]|uniref:YolD-like family protein n=1 Tax=Planococcus sp. APC 3906 TaxID=3035194 RepID=UPI0025B488A8|nr:YolD-like family protein [Planococcus sp. APC 3906]MDN3448699.1 YolD-like family protein [Planococcus sp. APC 3906]